MVHLILHLRGTVPHHAPIKEWVGGGQGEHTGVHEEVDGLGKIILVSQPEGIDTPRWHWEECCGLRREATGCTMNNQGNEQGSGFRRRLVEGQLTAEDTDSIPACFHSMLKYMERKGVDGGKGEQITSEDYKDAGLMQPISSSKWIQFWSRARAGERGGASELHATIIKAAMKKVFTEEGQDGRSRQVAKTDHVVGGLGLLVDAAREGRFFLQ